VLRNVLKRYKLTFPLLELLIIFAGIVMIVFVSIYHPEESGLLMRAWMVFDFMMFFQIELKFLDFFLFELIVARISCIAINHPLLDFVNEYLFF
jgi:hypothetical protein